jgi:hypothetical protein
MSRDFLSGLADESAAQVVKFIRFFNSKREVSLSMNGQHAEQPTNLVKTRAFHHCIGLPRLLWHLEGVLVLWCVQ